MYFAMRYMTLKTEEIETQELMLKNSANNTIRKRCQCLLLSHQRRTITDLSSIFNVSRRTIGCWFGSWVLSGVDSLPIMPGRGVKTRLKGLEEDIAIQLELHSRNFKNLLLFLEKKHNINICKRTL